jgi:hypothetical protein
VIGDDEVFDSREAEERIDEIESEHRAHWDDDEREEHERLVALRDGVELDYPMQWRDGITFLHEDHLTDHAQQYGEDIEGIDSSRWPYDCIDWEQAGEKLAEDYQQIEFRGDTWYYY